MLFGKAAGGGQMEQLAPGSQPARDPQFEKQPKIEQGPKCEALSMARLEIFSRLWSIVRLFLVFVF